MSTNENLETFMSPDYVDLSAIAAPKVIEELDYETIFQQLLADFKARRPEYNAFLESDPVIIALECAAYREVLLRNRINEAAKASMLAYATGSDLDNLAAFYGITRMIIDAGDPNATPPVLPMMEEDGRLRYRTQMALESFTTAGSEQAYLFHTYSASPKVKSAKVDNPKAGKVSITLLSTDGDGTADHELLDTVRAYVSADEKRPLTDQLIVQSAKIITYSVKAVVHLYQGPSATIAEAAYTKALKEYLTKRQTIGGVVAVSGIYDALHNDGVCKVELIAPTQDITPDNTQAAFCNNIELQVMIDG